MKPLKTSLTAKSKTYSQKLIALLEERECITEEDKLLISRLQRQSRGRSLSLILGDVGIEEDAIQQAVADVSGLTFNS